MSLLNASHHPPLAMSPEATVLETCNAMMEMERGAVAVVEEGRLLGIFTERDVMRKVVVPGKDPKTVRLREVMTSPCFTIPSDRSVLEALNLMVSMKINHLALVGKDNNLIGMLSYRTLLGHRIENLNSEVEALAQYLGSDGIGGD